MIKKVYFVNVVDTEGPFYELLEVKLNFFE